MCPAVERVPEDVVIRWVVTSEEIAYVVMVRVLPGAMGSLVIVDAEIVSLKMVALLQRWVALVPGKMVTATSVDSLTERRVDTERRCCIDAHWSWWPAPCRIATIWPEGEMMSPCSVKCSTRSVSFPRVAVWHRACGSAPLPEVFEPVWSLGVLVNVVVIPRGNGMSHQH